MELSSNKPNLFIIGAMKSGTTYLHGLLSGHPDIYMSKDKEPSYFADPIELKERVPEMWVKGYWKNEKKYFDLFKAGNDSIYRGESSALYANFPLLTGIPQRINNFNPDAKLIYVLRDPIERSISHYWMHVNYYGFKLDPFLAIKKKPELLAISNYMMQLEQFLMFFDMKNIFITTFEELTSDPLKCLAEIMNWLNIDKSFIPDDLFTPKNVTPKKIRAHRGFGLLIKLRNSRFWDKTSKYFPSWFTFYASHLAEYRYDKNEVLMDSFKDHLRSVFLPQVDDLKKALNRNFDSWKTINKR